MHCFDPLWLIESSGANQGKRLIVTSFLMATSIIFTVGNFMQCSVLPSTVFAFFTTGRPSCVELQFCSRDYSSRKLMFAPSRAPEICHSRC